MQESEKWPYKQSVQKNEMHKILWDFEIQTDHLNLGQTTKPNDSHKKKRTCWMVDFAAPADYRIKLKGSVKWDKYQNLARELKKLRNMKVSVIPIVVGALGIIPKTLVKRQKDFEIRRQVVTIQTTALLRSGRILRRVLETWGDLLSLRLKWETIN